MVIIPIITMSINCKTLWLCICCVFARSQKSQRSPHHVSLAVCWQWLFSPFWNYSNYLLSKFQSIYFRLSDGDTPLAFYRSAKLAEKPGVSLFLLLPLPLLFTPSISPSLSLFLSPFYPRLRILIAVHRFIICHLHSLRWQQWLDSHPSCHSSGGSCIHQQHAGSANIAAISEKE